MTNLYPGLHRGPIDHQSASVINKIANAAIGMGQCVQLVAPPAAELAPRVAEAGAITDIGYGIAVGGDADGIYGTGIVPAADANRAATAAGQGVVIVTQGRCLANLAEAVTLGAALSPAADGRLQLADTASHFIIARAMQAGSAGDCIEVDVQREGAF